MERATDGGPMEEIQQSQQPAAGWYPDPQAPGALRYWDGANWTSQVAAVGAEANQEAKPSSGKAVASLVLGIIGMLAWLIPLFGLPISVTGLVLGATSTNSTRRTMAIFGIVLCSIALLATIANAALGIYLAVTGQNPLVNSLLNN